METTKDILEILYFISGPALVLIGYFALSQIKVAREQIEAQREASKINSKRDALRTTSEQVTRYCNEIIDLQNKLDHRIEAGGIKFFEKSKVKISGDNIQVNPCSDENERKKLLSIMMEFTNVMNAMEGFSIYFISGVADEKVAYLSLSNTFCGFIKKVLPLVVPVISDGHRLSATIKLFHIWNARLEAESLKQQKEDLEKKLKDNKLQSIKTVGYDA